MHKVPVGDDVLGDDPTVIELQERVASMLKEAGLFVARGRCQTPLRCEPTNDEIVCDKTATSTATRVAATQPLRCIRRLG